MAVEVRRSYEVRPRDNDAEKVVATNWGKATSTGKSSNAPLRSPVTDDVTPDPLIT